MRREEPTTDAEVGLSNTDPEEEVLGKPKAEEITSNVNVVTIDETIKTKNPEKRRSSIRKIEYGNLFSRNTIEEKLVFKNGCGSLLSCHCPNSFRQQQRNHKSAFNYLTKYRQHIYF